MESAEQGVWSRYSFIGVENLGFLVSGNDSVLKWISNTDNPAKGMNHINLDKLSGFEALELLQSSWRAAPVENLPPLVSGMVGLMGWDTIHQIEKLDSPKKREFPMPDLAMAIIQDMVVLDHLDSSLKLVSNIYLDGDQDLETAYQTALKRIEQMKVSLLGSSQPFIAEVDLLAEPEFDRRSSDAEFIKIINTAKEHVVAGDVFQVVVSQRFDMETKASALDVYRMLRALNPSPYMYLFNFFD